MNQQLLEVKQVSKNYGDKQVVKEVSFSLSKGDVLGFIGPNGAGKSTMIHMITTILKGNQGTILYKGTDINSQDKRYKKAIGIVPQDLAIYEDLNAYDNVSFFCSLYGFKGKQLKQMTQDALEYVGLWERKKDLPSTFSGGMKRRLNIACAIAHKPEILIMDEPTVGIDPQSRNHILKSVELLCQQGTSVIYTSHYMEEIETLCNRIVLIDQGIILEDMTIKGYKEKYQTLGYHTLEEIFLYRTGTELRDEGES